MHEVSNPVNESDINQHRADLSAIQKKLFLEREKLNRIADKKNALNRYFNPDIQAHVDLRTELLEKEKYIESNINNALDEVAKIENQIKNLNDRISEEDKYKYYLHQKFSSEQPIFLMPLRLETRFKKVENGDELWVRIFPDDCSIDTFEEVLSESEIQNAQDFWTDWLIAAGNEIERRGAWRSLVDSHGTGRAQYIINNYLPDDFENIFCLEEDTETRFVHLVISAEKGTLKVDEKKDLGVYWKKIWIANGNADQINEAYNELKSHQGEEHATYLIKNYFPKNINDDSSTRDDIDPDHVAVIFMFFPPVDEVGMQKETWAHAPKVNIMPERLYLLGYRGTDVKVEKVGKPIPCPLICGPDPKARKEDLEDYLESDLKISQDMKWMVDFDEAVKSGMGFKINNNDDVDKMVGNGYDRMIVVGVRFSADKTDAKKLIEELIHNHYYGNSGFGFLQVGTNTNNVLESKSGYTEKNDADESYEIISKYIKDLCAEEIDIVKKEKNWWAKSDREWFSELLGISPGIFKNTINTDGSDQCEARAMNIALWPATWGYFFETMMQPVLNNQQTDKLRDFFNYFVIGRGTIPSVRIDDQPYGILPTTVLSRINWFNDKSLSLPQKYQLPSDLASFLGHVHNIFAKIQVEWRKMLSDVSHVGKEGDPHQILLDILGLHGGSVEFYSRYAQSLNHLWNYFMYISSPAENWVDSITTGKPRIDRSSIDRDAQSAVFNKNSQLYKQFKKFLDSTKGKKLLRDLGYTEEDLPEIFEKVFLNTVIPLNGPLIDDQPLSEQNPIKAYTKDRKNYIEWLINAAINDFETLRCEKDITPPNALLYLMLRYALELGYWDAGTKLSIKDEELIRWVKMEPDFIHVGKLINQQVNSNPDSLSGKSVYLPFDSESKYNVLFQNAPGNSDITIAQYISEMLKTEDTSDNTDYTVTRYLRNQINALDHLRSIPTARLERAFVEHLDCATYRFDAWKWGIVNYQLLALRNKEIPDSKKELKSENGLYIGAYGWLENVYSENKILTSADLNQELSDTFNQNSKNPIYFDINNFGYIQAPSLNQAVTASILRNAYLAKANAQSPEIYGINLSSERIRKALSIIEGLQHGQNLAALLGYHFERFIHDNNQSEEVDDLIYPLRRQFPLVSNQMASTSTDDLTIRIETLEARNVINGTDLLKFVEKRLGPNGQSNYIDDFNFDSISSSEKEIIIQAVEHIRDINDAVADLGLAESVHQVVQGNIDRAAGTLDTYSKGNYPQMPDVVQTPRSGVNITHRVGIQIDPDATYTGDASPRAMAEPGLNELLGDLLPEMNKIICTVDFELPESGTLVKDYKITMENLSVQAIDLIYIISDDAEQAMSTLDDYIIHWVRTNYRYGDSSDKTLRGDADIKINYYAKKESEQEVSVFEIIPLIKSLRALLLRSRPLIPSDLILPNEFNPQMNVNVDLSIEQRIARICEYIYKLYDKDEQSETGKLVDLKKLLNLALEGDSADDENTVAYKIDVYINTLLPILYSLSFLGSSHIGIGFAHDWRRQQIKNVMVKIEEIIERWNEKTRRYNELIDCYENETLTDEEKLSVLMKAERIISTKPTMNPEQETFYSEVKDKKASFDQKLGEFHEFLELNHQGISNMLSYINSNELLNYDSFDLMGIDLSEVITACNIFARDLLNKVELLIEELKKRLDRNSELAKQLKCENNPIAKVRLINKMAKNLITEDFQMIPPFELPPEQIQEWADALSCVDQLLKFQKEVKNNPLPIDDWFYSIARVREKMGHFEQITTTIESFKDLKIELLPMQLPRLSPYCWLALQFVELDDKADCEIKEKYLENDHLLYTAYYHKTFSKEKMQCGLLIDEWTEIIPTPEETTGIAFHYDRPNSEAPQTMLLVTSPQMRENWKWEDLVDAIYETLDEAKMRAIEPHQIDQTGFANFLPANISPVSKYPISIMLNYGFNNLPIK